MCAVRDWWCGIHWKTVYEHASALADGPWDCWLTCSKKSGYSIGISMDRARSSLATKGAYPSLADRSGRLLWMLGLYTII